MALFEKAKWIWKQGEAHNDEFADFAASLTAKAGAKYTLKLASDSNYALYINGCLAEFGQYADYPQYKVADVIDITQHIAEGENKLAIIVWYYGKSTQAYIHGDAGLIFEITENDIPVLWSDETTLSRTSKGYVPHEERLISGQLGFTYHFDAMQYDGFWETGTGMDFTNSRIVDNISYSISPRPNKKLVLKDRINGKICMAGEFEYKSQTDYPERNMQNAAITHNSFHKVGWSVLSDTGIELGDINSTQKENNGIYFIVDLFSETAGFLDIDIELPCAARIDVGYGEHLYDGRCRTAVRNFSCVYEGKVGRNKFLNAFRRFGCRYVQFFIHASYAKVYYAGIRPTEYPLTFKKYQSGNLLRDTIYQVCQNTLLQSLHEHYEDCPWREQALYCMDSRNQMLCGYYAFNEYQAPRASLQLMGYGLLPSKLLSICYPCGGELCIPSFTAVYFIQMWEYIKYSGDTSLAQGYYGMLQDILAMFLSRKDETGVIKSFEGGGMWNFYEWSDDMSGDMNGSDSHEAPINAFLSLSLASMAKISESLGKSDDAILYQNEACTLNNAIEKIFYNKDVKLFENRLEYGKGHYNVLTNSLCMLCGAAENVDKSVMLKIMASNGKDNDGLNVTPNTLSMNSFRFDALLAEDKEKYSKVILDELDRDYLYMLREGATSFWETIDGQEAFGYAGSLCHGWSALPIYYYELLN